MNILFLTTESFLVSMILRIEIPAPEHTVNLSAVVNVIDADLKLRMKITQIRWDVKRLQDLLSSPYELNSVSDLHTQSHTHTH